MSQNITLNGNNYIIPDVADDDWGQNLTDFFVAIPQGVLQKTGGAFTLSADVDFGAAFGLKSLYYKSRTANTAQSGIVRLANNGDAVAWRNAANSGDLTLYVNASDELIFNGTPVSGIVVVDTNSIDLTFTAPNLSADLRLDGGTLTIGVAGVKVTDLGIADAQISLTAAIAYSKLNLSNSIVNGDINAAAAIDYSKINVPTNAIALNKLAALTINRAVASDASGVLTASATTDTELGYLSGVTSNVQTQIGDRVLKAGDTMTGALHLPNGTGAAPALTGTDTDTGLYFGSDVLNVSTGGTLRLSFRSTDVLSTVPLLGPTGTAAAPGHGFSSEVNTGLFLGGAGQLNITCAGTNAWGITTSGILPANNNAKDVGTLSNSLRSVYIATGAVFKATGGGTNNVQIEPPATVTASYRIALPSDAPTALNQIMRVSALGTPNTLEWGASGGGVYEYVAYTVGTASGSYTGSLTVYDLPFSYAADGKTLSVFYNGQQLVVGVDYNETSTTRITTTSPLVSGGKIWFRTISAPVAPSVATNYREDYIVGTPSGSYTGSLTVFNLTNSYNVGGNNLMVTLDGDVQTKGASVDYVETGSTVVTFNNTLIAGQKVSFIWSQSVGNAGVNTGTAGQVAYYAGGGNVVSGTSTVTISGNQMLHADGSVSLPAMSFASDPDTGIFWDSANQLNIATNGTARWKISNTALFTDSNSVIYNANGAAATPSYTFQNDPDTGFFRSAGNSIGIAAGGSQIGYLSFDGVALKGTITNDSAAAGYIGQYVESVVSVATSGLATGTWGDMTSISLTAGDWDVTYMLYSGRGASATLSAARSLISTTAGNSSAGLVEGSNHYYRTIPTADTGGATVGTNVIAGYRMSVASTTTVYAKAYFDWTGSTSPSWGGRISARRVR